MPVTEEIAKLSGSLTISGGRYSFWNGREMQKVSGTPMTFQFVEVTSTDGSLYFEVLDNNGNIVYFIPEDETGLNNVNVSCHFPAMPSFDGTVNLGTFRTTQEQLNEYAPYIEYIRDGSKVTGLKYRLVKTSDTDTALQAEDFTNVFFNVWGANWNWLRFTREENKPGSWYAFDPRDTVEGTVFFDESVEESDIWTAEIWFTTGDGISSKTYHWYFFDNKLTPNVYLWRPHDSQASLINGKSDYRNAKFAEVDMYVEAENIIAEAKYFMGEGKITIPGGGYTIVSDDSSDGVSVKKVLETVEAGKDMTFGLRMHTGGSSNAYIGTTWAEYEVIDDSRRSVAFTGGAEIGLNGKNITWTFPAELGMNGSDTLPKFKSASEQFAGVLPYVEVVSSDGYVTALNYRLVMSNDTSTAITPSYRFVIESRDAEAKRAIRLFRSNWQNETAYGTFTFNEPIPFSQIYNVQVRLRSHEDSRRPVYIWHFFKTPSPAIMTAKALPNASRKQPYSTKLTATGISPITWTKTSGELPPGIKLNSSGKISGTPTSAGQYNFTVKASNSAGSDSRAFTLKVTQATVSGTIPTTTTRKAKYTGTPKATGGASPYVWSISAGKLPDGLKINSSTGKITGTTTKAGTFTFTVKAKDKNGAAGKKEYTVKVTQAAVSGTIPATTTRKAKYTGTPKASGGASPYVWSISAGSLPDGLKLNTSTGQITGTPSRAGTFKFTVKAKDKNGAAGKKECTVRITRKTSSLPATISSAGKTASQHIAYTGSYSTSAGITEHDGNTTVISLTTLKMASDDVISAGTGHDFGIVNVRANMPLRFFIGEWIYHDGFKADVSNICVYVDYEAVDSIEISDEGTFILPAEMVRGGICVSVQAFAGDTELETEELNINALE